MSDESTHFMTSCTRDVHRFSTGVKHSQPFPCTATLGLPCAGHGRRDTRQGTRTQDKGQGTQDARRDLGHGTRGKGNKTQDTGHRTRATGHRTRDGTRDTGHDPSHRAPSCLHWPGVPSNHTCLSHMRQPRTNDITRPNTKPWNTTFGNSPLD